MNPLMPAPLSLHVQRLLNAVASHLAAGRRRHQDRQALAGMDSRELSDLGVGRGEIERLGAASAAVARWAD